MQIMALANAAPTIRNAYRPFIHAVAKEYEELNEIGRGAYGTVYKAKDLNNGGKIVALKKVKVELTADGVPTSTLREIALLKQLDSFDHPNIVKLLDVCHSYKGERERSLVIFLVFEHLERDLEDFISSSNMTPRIIQKFSRELLTGIDFLHSHRIIHRDLKPQNLLVSASGDLKLADFGLAKTYDFNMKLTTVVVTLWYRAPEVLLAQPYNSSVDIWSAACIIAEMFEKKPLFQAETELQQLNCIFNLIGRPLATQWPSNLSVSLDHFKATTRTPPNAVCKHLTETSNDLLYRMLNFVPEYRPSAFECLQHPYFNQEPL